MAATISNSCTKDDEDTQPDLPPLEALVMDFSDFTTMPDTNLKSTETYTHFAYAFTTVSVWNLLTGLAMIVPVAAYAECFNHTPVYQGENTWEWSYSVPAGDYEYEAKLVTKRINNETFSAKMYISMTGIFEDFIWFEGVVRYDRTYALWTVYESPTNNVEWLSVEWNKNWEAGTSDITYTIIKDGASEYGSYISFGITDDTEYNAYYYITGNEGWAEIKWNTTTKAGMIMSTTYFGDSEWHCWNESFQNIDCG
jgi:hypothetical protein